MCGLRRHVQIQPAPPPASRRGVQSPASAHTLHIQPSEKLGGCSPPREMGGMATQGHRCMGPSVIHWCVVHFQAFSPSPLVQCATSTAGLQFPMVLCSARRVRVLNTRGRWPPLPFRPPPVTCRASRVHGSKGPPGDCPCQPQKSQVRHPTCDIARGSQHPPHPQSGAVLIGN